MRKLYLTITAFLLSFSLFAQKAEDPSLLLTAVTLYTEGEYEKAYNILSPLSELYPDDDAISYYCGLSALALRKEDVAEAQLINAVQKDTANMWYLQSLAFFYETKGEVEPFAHYSARLIEKFPSVVNNNPDAMLRIAEAQLMTGKDSLALHLYDRALELVPDYAPAILSKMFIYRRQGNLPPFFVCLEELVRNVDVRSDFKSDYLTDLVDNMTSQFYWVWGQTLENIVDAHLELSPEDPRTHLLKMRFNMIQGENEEAIARCRDMAAAARKSGDIEAEAEAYYLEGDLLYQLDKRKEAYKAYDSALKLKPDYPSVLNNYAYYLSQEQRPSRSKLKKALKMSTRVIELEPDNATYLDTHGWILYLLGRAEEAKPFFKHAMIYGGKDSAVVLAHYAIVLEELGETELANYYYNLSSQKQE